MFINLKSSLGMAIIIVSMTAAADAPIQALDVKASAFLRSGNPGMPAVCKTPQQLIDALGAEVAKQVESKVDFASQDVLVFKWSNSGSDKFALVKPEKPGAAWKFVLTKGNTKALIPDARAYVVSHGTSWHFESRPKHEHLLRGLR